jgi:hypothetical protein
MRRYLAISLVIFFFTPVLGHSQTRPHAPCPAWVGRISGGTQQTFVYERVSDKTMDLVKKLTSESPLVADMPLAIWDCGDPSDSEQYMLELFNRARANPDSEGIRLYNGATSDASLASDYNYWKSPTKDQVKSDFHGYQARPPLAMNKSILAAARAHSAKMIQVDSQYHNGPDGTPSSRLQSAGYSITGWSGEIVYAFGNDDLFYDEAVWQYDFGNPGLGHRENIMNFLDTTDNGGLHANAMYTEAGIGIVHGSGSGGEHVGPVVSTGDFAEGQHYILGVVYSDANHNGFYDLGEGVQGVTITASGASYTAVTTRSGGYAIPYKGSGSVTITANGAGFSNVQKVMQFAGENIKVDFNPSTASQVTLVWPPNDTALHVTSATFSWSAVPNATKYRIQIDVNDKFNSTKMFVNDSSLSGTTTSRAVTGMKDGNIYYWRVQAKVGTSWAPYSSVRLLGIALQPNAVTLLSPADNANLSTSGIIRFLWHPAAPSVTNYHFVIASDVNMTNIITEDSALNNVIDTSEVIDASTFEDGKRYYWTVRAQNDAGWGGFAAWSSFTIGTQSSVEENAYAFDVHVSPNPTSSQANIAFSLANEQSVAIRIFNSLGQDVATENLGRLSVGSHSWTWDVKNQPTGTYYYELRAGDRLEAGRIQVIR